MLPMMTLGTVGYTELVPAIGLQFVASNQILTISRADALPPDDIAGE